MPHRIEVTFKNGITDALGESVTKRIIEYLNLPVESVRTIDAYTIDKELDDKQLEFLGNELFADPITFGLHVDGVIFIVREGKTSIKKIQTALTNLKECNVIGIVYNCATFDPMDSDFRYYYRYRNK